MTTIETIRAKMCNAASRTLGEARREDDPVLAALLASGIITYMLDEGHFTRQTLPLPPISRQFRMQLEVLWRRREAADEVERQAITGAFDRIVAELYRLTVDDLIFLQCHLQ